MTAPDRPGLEIVGEVTAATAPADIKERAREGHATLASTVDDLNRLKTQFDVIATNAGIIEHGKGVDRLLAQAIDHLRELVDDAPCEPPGSWCAVHQQRNPCPVAAARQWLEEHT